ncbi:MAG TPA: hypothetical protein VNW99_11745 [Cytophagaceae bacterium]|jgi:hypothetical protein|nr:hypothetical protein [Cytophagaceae bacterium]
MTALLNPIKKALILSIAAFIFFLSNGCHKRDYPCPGLGKSNEADMSLFDENGKLKDKKNGGRRIGKDNGLVQKKKPKKLNSPRKTHL